MVTIISQRSVNGRPFKRHLCPDKLPLVPSLPLAIRVGSAKGVARLDVLLSLEPLALQLLPLDLPSVGRLALQVQGDLHTRTSRSS